MFSAIVRKFVERGVYLAWIHILAADREHVIDAPENTVRQARIGPSTWVPFVDPSSQVPRRQADHRLRGAFEMGVHRRSSLPVGDPTHGFGVAHFRVDDVLPAEHSVRLGRTCHVHPRTHLGHGAAVVNLGPVEPLDALADGRDRGAGLAGEEHDFDLHVARVQALVFRDLGEAQGVGRRTVEGGGLQHVEPLHAARRHAGRAGAKRERFCAEAFCAGERPPTPHIERKYSGNTNRIPGAQTHAPHDTRMRVGYSAPVAL